VTASHHSASDRLRGANGRLAATLGLTENRRGFGARIGRRDHHLRKVGPERDLTLIVGVAGGSCRDFFAMFFAAAAAIAGVEAVRRSL
jgi:hypothetical protein